MPSIIRASLTSALFVLATAACAAAPADGHVAVLSVDGLGASELFAGPSCLAPDSTIRSMAARGAYSRGVRGVLPAITYPAHATLSTGTLPTTHGVVDNGLRGEWFKERSRIGVETLWDAARRAGRTVAIVTWPSTYGAQAEYLIPEDLANFSVPVADIRKGSTAGLFDSLASAVGMPKLLPFTHPDAGTPLDEMTARFAAEVVKRHKPQLLLAHFLDYDHRMHAAPWSAEACRSLARTDAWIAHIVEGYRAAGILDRTTFFIVSDHGFLEVKKAVNLHAMLLDAGWNDIFPGEDVATAFELKLAAGSAAIYPGKIAAAALARGAARLRPRLEKRHGGAVRWVTPNEARTLGGYPGAVFALCARPGHALAVLPPGRKEILVEPPPYRGAHGYCPDLPQMDAAFIASGFGVRRAGAIARMSMTDVGPTIAAFVGARLPQAVGKDRSPWLRPGTGKAPR